ncbi:MAG: dienelactone hydrolase family protein [Phycisphaerae bacterium]
MNRREFVRTASGGVLLGSAANLNADRTVASRPSLPATQHAPLPELGTHWTNVFEKLSARCDPKMSFLREEFTDPKAWTEQARAVLLANLHYNPPKSDPSPELTGKVDCGTYVREHIRLYTTPDIRVSAFVLVPKNVNHVAPGIVALHDHGGFYLWGKEKLVQVDPEHPELAAFKKTYYGGRSIADELARRGFVVIVPDLLHWGERGLYLDADPPRIRRRTLDVTAQDVAEFNARSWAHEELISRTALTCGVTWAGINIWDDMRVTDYLLTRPEVDPKRIGCLGLSLGSVRTIFLGALHPAIRASVACCWMAEYQPMTCNHIRNGIGLTKLVPGLYADLDWPDVAALHWPDALMTINGTKDTLYPLAAARQAVDKVRRIYEKMGVAEKYEGVFFEGPHEFNVQMQERAFDWLTRQL